MSIKILLVGARKGDEQVGRTLFFDKCQTTGVGGQVVQGDDLNYISIVFQWFSCQWVKPLLTNVNNKMVIFKGFPSSNCELHSKIEGGIFN